MNGHRSAEAARRHPGDTPADARPAPAPTSVIAIWIPDWPVVAAMLEHAIDADIPTAVAVGQRIEVPSAVARAAGIRRGMKQRTAQELCPGLRVLPSDPNLQALRFEGIAAAVEGVVPGLTVVRPGLLWASARGALRHHESPEALAEAVVNAVTVGAGTECGVGIGGTPLAAMMAAREGALISPQQTAQYVAQLPVGSLRHVAPQSLAADTALDRLIELLERLGIATMADLAAMPRAAVRDRCGPIGQWALTMIQVPVVGREQGEDPGPTLAQHAHHGGATAWKPHQVWEVVAELDPPASNAQTVAFAAMRPATQFHQLLMVNRLTCGRLQVAITTEHGDELVRWWQVDDGVWGAMDARQIVDRIRWQVDGWLTRASQGAAGGLAAASDPPVGAVVRLTLTAQETSQADAVGEPLWGQDRAMLRRLGRAIGRIQGLIGEDRVLAAAVQGGRIAQQRVTMTPWGHTSATSRPVQRPWQGALPSPAPPTTLMQAVAVSVTDQHDHEVIVNARVALSGTPLTMRCADGRVQRIVGWAGPWPMVERWWLSGSQRGAYLQVVTDSGEGFLLVARDSQWWCEARYD